MTLCTPSPPSPPLLVKSSPYPPTTTQVSLHTQRKEVSSPDATSLGSRCLAWIIYKIKSAFSLYKRQLFVSTHAQLKARSATWLVIQFSAIVAFALVFFPTMLLSTGMSGVVRYWAIPFVAMHVSLGSFNLECPKEKSRQMADKAFQVSSCVVSRRPKRRT